MADIWYKCCPQCRNYIKKNDPQEAASCCSCGWEEYAVTFYCAVANKYCEFLCQENGQEWASKATNILP